MRPRPEHGDPVPGRDASSADLGRRDGSLPELTIDKSAVTAFGDTINPDSGFPVVAIGDTVSYTLKYTLVDGPVTNGIITDVVPAGLQYVAGTATNNEEFTFGSAVVNANGTTTLTWTAPSVTDSAPPNTPLEYDVKVLPITAVLDMPLVNVATIDSDQTPPDDDDQPVTVATPQLQSFTPAGVCAGNIPYLQYSFDTVALPAGNLTVTFVNPGGADVVYDNLPAGVPNATGVHYEGQVLWPGVVLDADGNIVDWPGWTLNADGTWTEGDAFSWARPVVDVTFAIDPVSVTLPDVAYPPESTVCANPPPALGIVKDNDAPITTVDTAQGPVDLPTANEGDTVTYTLTYNTNGIPQTNGVVTDVLPAGVTYVDGSASNNDEFTFVSYTAATRTLRWEAPTVTKGGTLTYKATVDEGAAELQQPLINVATIVTDQQPPDSDDSPVFVAPLPLELTPPPTDALAPSATPSNPGFALMLILLSVAALALAIGFVTPVPEHVRRRDRLG